MENWKYISIQIYMTSSPPNSPTNAMRIDQSAIILLDCIRAEAEPNFLWIP